MFLPTGKSLTLIYLNIPFESIIYVALIATPASSPDSIKHSKSFDIYFFRSDNIGIFISPSPPCFLGFFVYCICEYWESTEQAIIYVLTLSNYSDASENPTISVGHTNVKFNG